MQPQRAASRIEGQRTLAVVDLLDGPGDLLRRARSRLLLGFLPLNSPCRQCHHRRQRRRYCISLERGHRRTLLSARNDKPNRGGLQHRLAHVAAAETYCSLEDEPTSADVAVCGEPIG